MLWADFYQCMDAPKSSELEIQNRFLECAVNAMFSVEDRFIESFGQEYDKRKSGDHWDVVTEADSEIEDKLIESIELEYSNSSFIVEEGSNINTEDTLTWIIDPIDGTMNYSHGIDYCGTSIGIEKDGDLMGVQYIFLLETSCIILLLEREHTGIIQE